MVNPVKQNFPNRISWIGFIESEFQKHVSLNQSTSRASIIAPKVMHLH